MKEAQGERYHLEKLAIELQTFARSHLAKRRLCRLALARTIIRTCGQLKAAKQQVMVMRSLAAYSHELTSTLVSTDLLEYGQLPLFSLPLVPPPTSATDRLANQAGPPLVGRLNALLVLLAFPADYWREKLLRLEATKLLWSRKADWGETRRRWLANYLVAPGAPQKRPFRAFFRKHAAIFAPGRANQVHFAAYILKTNVHNLEHIRALLLTDSALYKVNIDDRRYLRWLPLEALDYVSLTPGADQLVVLHLKPSAGDSDHVFSFYSTKSSSEQQQQTNCWTSDSKVGEFVALLCKQYKAITKTELPLNISERIFFRFNKQPYSISVKQLEVTTTGDGAGAIRTLLSPTSVSSFLQQTSTSTYNNIWKRLRQVFYHLQNGGLQCVASTSSGATILNSSELLKKRINFEFVDRTRLELLYN